MKTWRQSLRDGVLSGTTASVLSTLALALRGRQDAGSVVAPTNAVSHWLWGDRAAHQDRPSLKYTLVGYLIHHASATFWAVLYEKFFGRRLDRGGLAPLVGTAVAMSAVACVVDYKLTPQRLQPGYEKRLSTPSLVLVYAAFGIGLAVGAGALRGMRHD